MMGLSVLHPGLLIAGLLCVSIPVLVHLLRRKHRPISWGAMRFLEQAYKKRKRLITLEQLLLLLTRCAMMLCIAGAVGALVMGSGVQDQQERTLVFVIDNSIHSAGELDSGVQSIQYQKQRALELLGALDPANGDRVALITASSPARGDALPATSELGLIRSRIESIESTDAERDLEGALELLDTNLTNSGTDSTIDAALMLSPFGWMDETVPQDFPTPRLGSILVDEPLRPVLQNIAIQSIDPLRPMFTLRTNERASLSDAIQGVRIQLSRSDTSADYRSRIELTNPSSGDQLGVHEVLWQSGQGSAFLTVPLRPEQINRTRGNWAVVRARLLEDDTNTRDNIRTTGFPVRSEMRVGIIDSFTSSTESGSVRASRWVRAALGADSSVISVQMIDGRNAENRIDPSLDALFILAPASLSDRGWSRIQSMLSAGMPILITADASSLSLNWIEQLQELAPGMLLDGAQVLTHESPAGLSDTLSSDGSKPAVYLAGIESEYPRLASSVQLNRTLLLKHGPAADVLLLDSQQQPVALAAQHDSQSGSLVLFGFAFDMQWTDLQARPLFVALMHELTRTMVSQSQSPRQFTAGSQININSPLEDFDGSVVEVDPRIAGTYVQVDQRGSGLRGVLINPDARYTAISADEIRSAQQTLTSQLDGIQTRYVSDLPSLSTGVFTERIDQGKSISQLLFVIAVVLGVFDFLLARRCSYKAVHSGSGQQGVIA